MTTKPDTTVTASVRLTATELGTAFANRDDHEQVRILRAIVPAFTDCAQAEMQACYIGKRLFAESSERETMDAISFLRMILYSCAGDAEKVRDASTLPEAST